MRQAPPASAAARVDRVGGRPGDLEGAQPAVDAERAGAVQRNLARARGRQRRLVLSEHGDLDLAVRLALESLRPCHRLGAGAEDRQPSAALVGDRLDGDGSGSLAMAMRAASRGAAALPAPIRAPERTSAYAPAAPGWRAAAIHGCSRPTGSRGRPTASPRHRCGTAHRRGRRPTDRRPRGRRRRRAPDSGTAAYRRTRWIPCSWSPFPLLSATWRGLFERNTLQFPCLRLDPDVTGLLPLRQCANETFCPSRSSIATKCLARRSHLRGCPPPSPPPRPRRQRASKPGALGLSSYSGWLRSHTENSLPAPGVLLTVMRPP